MKGIDIMKNRYKVETRNQYTLAYLEETKNQIKMLLKWIEKHPNATFEYCKKKFSKDIINTKRDATSRNYWFDMYYGNMCVTLGRNGLSDKLHIQGDIELYDDDFSGGSGEFRYDEEFVEDILKKEFDIDFYSVA